MAMASPSKKTVAARQENAASDASDAEVQRDVESGSGDEVEHSEGEDHDDDEEEEEEEDDEMNDDGDDDSEGSVGDEDGADILQPEDDADDDDEEMEAVGFGDAMSKILQQNVADAAQPILAKRTTARMREIMNEKKEIKQERMSAAEKRAKERKDNVVPSHASAAKDRTLRKIATKGVVALFNAIAKHQHQVGKPTEKEDKKVKELSKESFLGLLKSAKGDKEPSASKTETAASANKTWSVLQDDYMMGAKMKDWDAAHAPESARARRRADAKGRDDDSDPEAVEDRAWKQAEALDSDDDDDDQAAPASSKGKRKGATGASKKNTGKKNTKKAKH
ncbi:hypothetical protein PINS_up005817 [Pythium insidiosum]|nr:hypothetical protein PINS_up005817 [Pythium insidiosum]